MTHVTASSSRSMMIVANVAVALNPSCRASKYGRITSPARAGSTALAANPIVVVRNAGRKPRVADRLEQVLPPKRAKHHRHDRDGRRQRDQPGIRKLDFRPDDVQMGAAKEKREQANRQDDDDDGAKRFPHEIPAENSASTIRGVRGNAKNALVVVTAAKPDLPVNRLPDKIGAFRLSIEVLPLASSALILRHIP